MWQLLQTLNKNCKIGVKIDATGCHATASGLAGVVGVVIVVLVFMLVLGGH